MQNKQNMEITLFVIVSVAEYKWNNSRDGTGELEQEFESS